MKIHASLTTIPSRLPHLTICIKSILKDKGFDDVILNIPEKTLSGKPYPEEELNILQTKFGARLIINRIPVDYGPITKLVGCLDRVTDPDDVIVVFDDDRQLVKSITGLIKERMKTEINTVYSLGGWCFGKGYRIRVDNLVDEEVDSIMGTTCIAFRRNIIDKEGLLNYRANDPRLVKLDDLRISGYLSSKGIRRISIGVNAKTYLRDIEYEGTEKLSGNMKFWVDNKAVIDQFVKEGIFNKSSSSVGTSMELLVFSLIACIAFLIIAGYLFYKGSLYYAVFILLSIFLGVLSYVSLQNFIM